MAFNLLNYLSKQKGILVVAVILNHGILEGELKKLGISVYVVDEKKISFVKILYNVRRIIKNELPDIIHSHRYKENILNILCLIGNNIQKKVKYVSTQHGFPDGISIIENISRSKTDNLNLSEDNYLPKKRNNAISIHKINSYILSHYFDCTVSVSKEIRNILINNMKFDRRKTIYIHNGIVMPLSKRRVNQGNIITIGSAARFFPIKDFPLFIDIAKLLIDKNLNVRFVLVGDGPERGNIQNLVEKYEINKYFSFPGFKRELNDFYDELDLYINTSKHEGIPMSVLEAMAHGIPVIAPDVGGLREMIENGVDGFLVRSRDPGEYANICVKLIENKELRDRISIAGREKIVRYFSAEKMANSYIKSYIGLLNEMDTRQSYA